ncbi:MAG TPA: hypothetical protein VFS00_23905 [Polyangiaceae bacterium]|nr:hypothetical protein [Polyangiaceae bacterium]
MAENEGKTPRANDDDETPEEGERSEGAASEPAGRSKARAAAVDEGDDERPAAKATKPAKAAGAAKATGAAKARPTSTRDDDEDDDEYDDEDDDEDDDDEDDEVDEPPPPKRPVASKATKTSSKAAPAATKKGAAAKGKSSVYRKAPPPVRVAPRRPARYYVPYIGLGLGFVALHVWFDLPYQPVACLGIAIVIWAYLQIGSANEIIPGER